ncbi:MAG: hypothetical protein CVU17_05765 [Betaproteobacteria bacterium HGW-Betaproteobacteria-11]|nr:MAG: hypothetical protein CVU17_05765 [Betaproteobacteria bacterium HGW-Betaproteobacteria-11]
MFSLCLDGSTRLNVKSRSGVTTFATDGSAPNPFEGALATIAGCAGVYAGKACAAAGVSAEGIEIRLKPMVAAGSNDIRKLTIKTTFPVDFPRQLIPDVLASIGECPVKKLIQHGDAVEFVIDGG